MKSRRKSYRINVEENRRSLCFLVVVWKMFIRKQNICQFSKEMMLRASVRNQIREKAKREQPKIVEVEENSSEKYLTLILLSEAACREYKLLYRHVIGTQLTRNKQYREHLAWITRGRLGVLMCNSMSFLLFTISAAREPKSLSHAPPFDARSGRMKKLFFTSFTRSHCQSFPAKKFPANFI